jgi:RhtB (resistance to homoserine/threonine) family protein
MPGIINFETFLISAILLNLTPGNDTIFILSKSIGQGKKAGMVSALGIGTGNIIHTLLAAFGLSLIIAKSILLFNFIKYAGAIYLVYLGYNMLVEKADLQLVNSNKNSNQNYWSIYRSAIFTNILNPKVALFFIAFLPQFIQPSIERSTVPFILLGATFVVTGTIWCFCLALFASKLFGNLKNKASGMISKCCGIMLIGLAIKVAFTNRN